MARKRKATTPHGGAPGTAGGGPRPPATQRSRRVRPWGLALLSLVVLLSTWFVITRGRRYAGASAATISLPPPRATFASDAAAAGDFVGSEACATCHRAAFSAWSRSTHASAGGPPGSVRLLTVFDGKAIRFRDATVIPEARGGTWRFIVRQDARPEQVLRVDGVVGGGHMQGGGTQGFVVRWPDGTVRFLPWELHRQEGVWFCNTGTRANRGWVPITPDMQLADCGDWPPTRILGDEVRFANCQSCHGSQIAVRSDTVGHTYRTSYQSLGINCESCHGPGRRHIALVSDSAAVARGDLGTASLATQSKDASLGTCFQCHALKDQLRPGYQSGLSLETYYSLRFPQLGDAPHLPDGRVRTFAYQESHLYSDCYVNGGMTCTSCHDPHSQQYRDAQGRAIPGRFNDRQCTSCHASKAVQAERHTHHAANSEGSRCVSCHMPYLQEPEVGMALRYARSDHAIPIPRPLSDSALGVTSACRGCHTDRSEDALQRQLTAWYGEVKPIAPAVASVLAGRRETDLGRAGALLLLPQSSHTAAVFAGLAAFVDRHLGRDTPLPRDASDRLRALAQHSDLDVRALALAALHYAQGGDRATREFLAQQLMLQRESEPLVRSRWATAVGYLADRLRSKGDADGAAATFDLALEVEPANPRLHLNRGLALADAGRLADAVASYRASLALDSVQPLGWVNLGIALAGMGDPAGASAAYRRALAINSREVLAHFNLGNLQLEAGALDSAAASYRAVIATDPSISLAHFYLARIMAQRGELRAAAAEIEAGLEFDPNNAEAKAARAQLTRLMNTAR